ncbi:hypothetical protein FRB96_006587 [Tulasnella sp. 330]|nr:hypothetical protein FRB96_006587 [Tulasnella sp. 330]
MEGRADEPIQHSAMNPTMDGKLLEIGILERDEDGFEDFNQYMNDDVFKSPPPAITPKRKPKPKTPAKPSSLRTGSNNDIDRLYSNSRNDPTTPRGYFASASPGPPPSTSRRVGSHSRPLAAPAPQVDYDSIPAPSTRKKPISTASSSQNHNRGAANAIARAGPSYNNRTPKTKTPASRRKSVAAAREVSEDSNLSVEGQSQPINDDVDDDSGPEAFNPPDDDVMQVDQEPEPILPRKLDAKNRGKSRLEPEPEERVPVRKADTKGRRKPSVPEPIPEEDEEGMVEDASEAGGGGGYNEHDMNDGMGGGGGYDGGDQYDDQQEENQPQVNEDDDEDEQEVPPPKKETAKEKKARLAAEKKAQAAEKKAKAGDRVPLKARDMNAQPKVKTEFKRKRNQGADDEDSDHDGPGPRRSKRERFEPLKWWKGEKVVVRPPRNGETRGVLHVEGIIRVPDDEVAPLGLKKKRRGTTKPPSSRGASRAREVHVDMNPEEGWDAETEELVTIIDYDTGVQLEKAIAQTAAMMSPKTPADADYSFQKVFMDGEFIAGGILNMPVGGKKPNKGARDNTYIFFVVEGAVRVMVNKTDFIITTNGMFMVPRGNMYYLENIGDRECKLFFAQARKVTQRMIPSPSKATSARPSSALGDRPSRTPQRAGAGAAQASPVAKGKKATSRM